MTFGYENKNSPFLNIPKRKSRYDSNILNSQVQKKIMEKEHYSGIDHNDKSMFNEGLIWFYQGYELNEAEDKDRNNSNFINGYNHGINCQRIADSLYELGLNDAREGKEPNKKYMNNEHYIAGYEAANHKIR